MACPFCGAVFGLAVDYGPGVMANSLANRIRTQHRTAALVVTLVGGLVIAAVLYLLAQLFLL